MSRVPARNRALDDPSPAARTAARARPLVDDLLSFGAITINYLDRANLSIALPSMQEELGLSKTVTGLLLGAFFWTYAAFRPVPVISSTASARAG
ncbi:hypothetical protein LV779_24800 [Streptomyces thinghirensis]|nr:hypothetical protein [Streptomyces thinghirensis]